MWRWRHRNLFKRQRFPQASCQCGPSNRSSPTGSPIASPRIGRQEENDGVTSTGRRGCRSGGRSGAAPGRSTGPRRAGGAPPTPTWPAGGAADRAPPATWRCAPAPAAASSRGPAPDQHETKNKLNQSINQSSALALLFPRTNRSRASVTPLYGKECINSVEVGSSGHEPQKPSYLSQIVKTLTQSNNRAFQINEISHCHHFIITLPRHSRVGERIHRNRIQSPSSKIDNRQRWIFDTFEFQWNDPFPSGKFVFKKDFPSF